MSVEDAVKDVERCEKRCGGCGVRDRRVCGEVCWCAGKGVGGGKVYGVSVEGVRKCVGMWEGVGSYGRRVWGSVEGSVGIGVR